MNVCPSLMRAAIGLTGLLTTLLCFRRSITTLRIFSAVQSPVAMQSCGTSTYQLLRTRSVTVTVQTSTYPMTIRFLSKSRPIFSPRPPAKVSKAACPGSISSGCGVVCAMLVRWTMQGFIERCWLGRETPSSLISRWWSPRLIHTTVERLLCRPLFDKQLSPGLP
jgi:hypothetical protein